MEAGSDRRISEAVNQVEPRLRRFVRKRVPDARDAEDILQDAFYELVEAYRQMTPIQHPAAWLFRVARNRIIDLFRRTQPDSLNDPVAGDESGALVLQDLLPSSEAGPEAAYARAVLLEELDAALDELPSDQRDVFIAHELEGVSFKEIAAQTGVGLNTLLSRKRYAVLYLRRRLQDIYNEFRKT